MIKIFRNIYYERSHLDTRYFEFLHKHDICFLPAAILTSTKLHEEYYQDAGLSIESMYE